MRYEDLTESQKERLFQVWTNTKAEYDLIEKKRPAMLYFCTDTREIFKGDVLYTSSVLFVEELPLEYIKLDCIYIVKTGENAGGYTYRSDTSEWELVIPKSVITNEVITLADIPLATSEVNGLLSSEDKVKYDGMVSVVDELEEEVIEIHKAIEWGHIVNPI